MLKKPDAQFPIRFEPHSVGHENVRVYVDGENVFKSAREIKNKFFGESKIFFSELASANGKTEISYFSKLWFFLLLQLVRQL